MAMNDNSIPLYTESKLTRKQAIDEIADVILRSNMNPRMVEYALQLIQKLLPVNNTLPTTIDELFGAMMSTEKDWRLAQYLIKHKQSPSFLPCSTNISDENSPMLAPGTNLFSIEERESNSPIFLHVNSNQSSSSSDDENELSPYDRLQQSLQPIVDISTNLNLNYARSSHDQRSELSLNSVNSSAFLQSLKRLISETSSTASTHEQNLFYSSRMFADFEDNTENDHDKLCCFEVNGHNLLNGNKRHRYD